MPVHPLDGAVQRRLVDQLAVEPSDTVETRAPQARLCFELHDVDVSVTFDDELVVRHVLGTSLREIVHVGSRMAAFALFTPECRSRG